MVRVGESGARRQETTQALGFCVLSVSLRCDAMRGDTSRDRLLADYFLQLGRGQILRFSSSLTGKGLSAPAGNRHRVQHLASRISRRGNIRRHVTADLSQARLVDQVWQRDLATLPYGRAAAMHCALM